MLVPDILLWTGRRTESVNDYSGVLVALEDAHVHSHSYRTGRRAFEAAASCTDGHDDVDVDGDDDDGGGRGKAGDDHEGTAMLEMSVPEYSIQGLRMEVRRGAKGEKWTAYEMKSKLINKAVQDIGMGRYNWQLFILCGFGWFADNLWMQGVSLTLPSLSAEFGISEKSVRYTTSALFLGLCLGSFFWGFGSDIMGRRFAFNTTLLITSVFGIASAWASSWGGVCLMYATLGFGVGGNLPVDGALFLEFLPDASSSLLTLLSVWWPIGQLVSSLFAWFFIANWPGDQGWRRFVLTIGIITFVMFLIRFFVFHLYESPKFLLSRGRQAEAVAVVHGIAFRNGKKTWLTEEILDAVVDDSATRLPRRLSTTRIIKSRLASFSAERIRPLFSSRKLGLTTAIMWFCWATIGMGYPLFNAFLPQYLSHGGGGSSSQAPPAANMSSQQLTVEAYRSYVITSLVGVPGSLLAAYAVDMESPFLGRRGTLAISTLVSALFLSLFAEYGARSASAQLLFSCVEAFAQNIMYGVLYAFTPEIFPAPVRGAGTGVASFLNRATGLLAPIIAATVPGDGTTGPIYLSAALILAAFVAMCLIPIETRGRQRL
ncbi:major facilitator superfamily domain-containing protein [Lasiosphaeria miniovina]|uniref:Major facilitator superfamily domain-containing protein n=1 Tax=Lasiosphaeria miniovina TaxID=1954250 RepID=A0AA40E908_9PEZI|nr:major facilitator superfamily domain-containing protein [Lasiosphaeria miniovina]KAK0728481.1 major facilitator superfamily domain-containing protein [Lasiosphaeria miniovina]